MQAFIWTNNLSSLLQNLQGILAAKLSIPNSGHEQLNAFRIK